MKLLIKQSAGALHTLPDVDATLSVAALKALLSEPPFSVPVEQQRLVYKGHVMKDNSTLADYGARRAPALRGVRGALLSLRRFSDDAATRARAPPRQAWRASTPFTSCGKTGACSRALALCRRAVVVTRGSPWVPFRGAHSAPSPPPASSPAAFGAPNAGGSPFGAGFPGGGENNGAAARVQRQVLPSAARVPHVTSLCRVVSRSCV
jgi:hypothetical protein